MGDLRRERDTARNERDQLRRENQNLRGIIGDIAPEYAEAFNLLCDIAHHGVIGDDLGTNTTSTFESQPPKHHQAAYHLRNEERRHQRARAQRLQTRISTMTGTVDDHPLAESDDATRDRTIHLFVYFCQATQGGPIKIGVASDPEGRLRELQAASPLPLRFIAVIPGSYQTERGLHEHFSEWRLHGEWFDEHADGLAALISKAQSQTPYSRTLTRTPESLQPSQNTLSITSHMVRFSPSVVRPESRPTSRTRRVEGV